jgi:hypothetical protein
MLVSFDTIVISQSLILILGIAGLSCGGSCLSGEVSDSSSSDKAPEISIVEAPAAEPGLVAVDTSRFLAVKVKQTERKRHSVLALDLEYPQVRDPISAAEISFNKYVKSEVSKQRADFIKFLDEKHKGAKSVDEIYEYELELSYSVDLFEDSFTSIIMNWRGFSGYLNYDYFPSTINYDLRKGRVARLSDISRTGSDLRFLEKLSQASRKILKVRCLLCGCGEGISSGDRLPEHMIREAEERNALSHSDANSVISYADPLFESGTEPKAENFRNWTFTPEGIRIVFDEYQVGPGCIGIISIIIPYNELRPILRSDLSFIKNV